MKVGDLVRYQDWWASEHTKGAIGLVIAVPLEGSDPKESDYSVFWMRGNYITGEYGCMGKFLEIIK
jgi:hypothetical protein